MKFNNLNSFDEFKKFKSIYEDNKKLYFENYELITEDLDFSNKTGFSESLVGRSMNRLFSFFALYFSQDSNTNVFCIKTPNLYNSQTIQ